jgi:acyl-CoA thioester hydrolase
MPGKVVPRRSDYVWGRALTTRWADNDVYGHVNNATYLALFDSAINHFLISRGGLDIHGGVRGLVVSSACDFFAPVAYPADVEVGLRVDRIGTSSVHYGVALFASGDDRARAAGTMVHVFVDRATSRPVSVPPALRRALETISAGASGSGA